MSKINYNKVYELLFNILDNRILFEKIKEKLWNNLNNEIKKINWDKLKNNFTKIYKINEDESETLILEIIQAIENNDNINYLDYDSDDSQVYIHKPECKYDTLYENDNYEYKENYCEYKENYCDFNINKKENIKNLIENRNIEDINEDLQFYLEIKLE